MSSNKIDSNTIQVEGGLVSGVRDEKTNVLIFKGVPYASPPIGNLRWCPPQPVKPWEGVKKCDSFPKICPQPFQPEDGFYRKEFYDEPDPEISEDCLYLNIWLPVTHLENKSTKLPVSLYIHGGAFDHGWGHEKEFDGEAFSKKNTILISINYRVNVFGFLCHPLINQNENTSCNLAILDILKAIKWTKQYISNFGGDPNRITLFGQSAGSMLTSTLSVVKISEGLFDNVILQSGIGYKNEFMDFMPLDKALKNGEEFFEPFNVKTVDDMQNIKTEDLLKRFLEFAQIKKELVFAPVIDGKIISKSFTQLVDENSFHPKNVIIGFNSNDIFIDALKKSVIQFSTALSSQKNKNVYTYFFSPDIPGDDKAGAFHSCELWYMFGTLKRCWRPFSQKDFDLSDKMVSYWCNFFESGDPNKHGLPHWPKFIDGHKMIELNYDISLI